MNEFYSVANGRIIKLIEQLSTDAREIEKTLKTDEEKGRLALNLLYYKIVLQGCIKYVHDIKGYVEKIQDCSIGESDFELILDKYCDNTDVPLCSDIVLEENPKIKTRVSSVSDDSDIILNENPTLKTRVAKISGDNDIILEENPQMNLHVSPVTKDHDIKIEDKLHLKTNRENAFKKNNDIVLDENPKLKINVAPVTGDHDIVLDENPPINMDVLEVSGDNDIVLDENSEINLNILKMSEDIDAYSSIDSTVESYSKNDIVLDENLELNIKIADVADDDEIPQKKESKNLPLFGSLNFKVKGVSTGDDFDLESFNKNVKACREKNKKSVKDNK